MSEYIDHEKAIAKIKAAYCCGCENYNGVRCRACQIMDAIDVLEDEPAVVPDVLRPVAHWNMDEDAVGDPIVWTCSNCKDSIIMYDGTPMENGYKYCPQCGAKMEDAQTDGKT